MCKIIIYLFLGDDIQTYIESLFNPCNIIILKTIIRL